MNWCLAGLGLEINFFFRNFSQTYQLKTKCQSKRQKIIAVKIYQYYFDFVEVFLMLVNSDYNSIGMSIFE